MLKSFRYLLFPVSIIYGLVIWIRNKLYDSNVWKPVSFNFPLICVGNLAAGGTGKTPMVEYLIRLLRDHYKIATLSRGYKRKTIGYALADEHSTALSIGDEPMQFHKKFPEVPVAVAEERVVGIPQILHDRPETEVIILDDAFQHRQVKAGLNILLTEYKNLYTRDFLLPAGDLRDITSSSRRADIIVVTKCISHLTNSEKEKITREIGPLPHQKVFFTKLEYGSPYHLFTKEEKFLDPLAHILLICGIANPKPIKEILNAYSSTYDMMRYKDHHIFDMDDLKEIKSQFVEIDNSNKIILTTEKDGVRLSKFEPELKDYPVYVFPIRHIVLFNEEEAFNSSILDYMKQWQARPL